MHHGTRRERARHAGSRNVRRLIYVAGTGSFAADVIEIAGDAGREVMGLVELFDRDRVGTTIHDLPVVSMTPPSENAEVVVGAGGDRTSLCERLEAHGWRFCTVVHPRAHVPRSVTLGEGTLVGPGAILGARSTTGRHVVLGRGCTVGHHTSIGSFATVNPGVHVAGNVDLAERAFLGIGAVVRDHVQVGEDAVVAAGAVVVDDVPAGVQVRGLPARPVQREP